MYEPLIGLGVAIVLGIYRNGSRLWTGSLRLFRQGLVVTMLIVLATGSAAWRLYQVPRGRK